MSNNTRRSLGFEMLNKIDGHAGDAVYKKMHSFCPDLADTLIEYVFGEIYPREGLDLKLKEMAVVAALTAMGNAAPQLKVHLNAAFNVGCTVQEVKEIILEMSGYSGFPSCLNGMTALMDVLKERETLGLTTPSEEIELPPMEGNRYQRGIEQLSKLDPQQAARLEALYGDFFPDFSKLMLEYGYGDIYSRPILTPKMRQITIIAALTALGNAAYQLKFHISAGLNIGLTETEIKELMLLMSVYAGYPAAINGTFMLKEVLEEKAQ